MPDNQPYTIELHPFQHDYLKDIVARYNLPDESKAVRCLINYAREMIDQEKAIFEDMRCPHC